MTKKTEISNVAIKVDKVFKTFKIPHNKINSVRGAFVNALKDNDYEKFNALNEVSFEIRKGEFFGIIGRNGSGKSTLLKILAGIYRPDKGKIKINGLVSPFLELGIGFNPELSGRDNIYLNGTVLGLTKKEIDERFDDIVAFSELKRFIDQKLKNYSSGMSVRLAFSVSIFANREILLMDEVLAVGDSNFQKKCIDVFRKYRDTNKTVVLVTHDIGVIRKYCDRAMLLRNGKVVEYDNVDKVCDAYVSKNISEEARQEIEEQERIKKKELERKNKLKNKKNKSTKNRIVKVEVLDKNNENIKAIKYGDFLAIKAKINLDKVEREDFVVAVQIFDGGSGGILCGNNTKVDKVGVRWKRGVNTVTILFNKTIFNRGTFYCRVVLLKKNGKVYDIVDEYNGKDNDQFIKIISRDERAGIIFLEHNWQIK